MFERLLANRALSLSVIALAVAAVMIVFQLPGLAGALFVPGLDDDTAGKKIAANIDEHMAVTTTYRDRFVGRSIFFTPDPPPRQVVQAPPKEDTGPPPPPPPPPEPVVPADYGGPQILALLGDRVHLDGQKIVKLGVEDTTLGLTVLEFVPPWSVKVRWHKKPGNFAPGEYVVEMFQRDYDSVFAKSSSGTSTLTGLQDAEGKSASAETAPNTPQMVED